MALCKGSSIGPGRMVVNHTQPHSQGCPGTIRTHQFSEVSALVVLHKPLQQRVKGKNTMILKVHFKLTLHKQYVVPNSNKMKHEQ